MLGRAGLQPDAYRAVAMRRRVTACLRRLRVTSPHCARALLERKPELLPVMINTALIGTSEFFRDRVVFDELAATVLPGLLKTRTRLRICSAGVSTGQELYSVAILLAEAGALQAAELVGVDCRPEALRRARGGLYRAEEMTGVDPERRARFFGQVEGSWEVDRVIKKRIQWINQDLLALDIGAACDLILFRNVAIYLNNRHGAAAWSRLVGQLVPGGYIVTGRAERPPAGLPLLRVAPSVFKKFAS